TMRSHRRLQKILANGVLTWPELAGDAFAHDGDILISLSIPFGEIATDQQWNPEGRKISRFYCVPVHPDHLLTVRWSESRYSQPAFLRFETAREHHRRARRFDARQRANSLQNRVRETRTSVVVVTGLGQVERYELETVRLEPRIG